MDKNSISSHRESGAALLIIVAILAIIAALSIGTRYFGGSTRKLAQTIDAKIDYVRVEDAIAAFWEANLRLPCPADITETVAADIGTEERDDGDGSCDATYAEQVIPWQTLRLPDSVARDAWGNYLAYHVWPALALDNAKSTAGTITSAITVKNAYNGTNMTTAAWFILISFGPNGKGAYNYNKQPIAISTDLDEAENTDGNTTYVKGGTPSSKFDDIVTYWIP